MEPLLYNEKSREEFLKRLEEINTNLNCTVQNHYSESGFQYLIRLNNHGYFCCSYNEIKLKISVPILNTINIGVKIPIVSGEYNLNEIVVIRLIDSYGKRVLDIISTKDKEKVVLAMKHAKNECNNLHKEGTIGIQILNDFYHNSSETASVENLYSIINQFDDQYKYIKEKKDTLERLKQKGEEAKEKAERDLRELKRQEYITKINNNKAQYNAAIKSEFFDLGLLNEHKLSNAEKIREYTSLRKFCTKYIPQLTERNFNIETLNNMYPYYISQKACISFKENWSNLNKMYSVLSRGINGEEKVNEVLRLFDDRIRILKDYVWGCEHDFIIITPYGISTIEVKNLRGDYILTETGILKCLSSDKIGMKDVAFQSKKHIETLRRNLKDCSAFSADIPLQEIICSAEPNFTIKNDYHYIPVCYYNTVDKILLPNEGRTVLSNEAMDEIYKYLLANQGEPFKYDVFLPHGEIDSRDGFISNFAEIASGYIVAQDIKE